MVNFMDGICPVFSGSCGFLATIDTERGFSCQQSWGDSEPSTVRHWACLEMAELDYLTGETSFIMKT
jgi:hypothetical protein